MQLSTADIDVLRTLLKGDTPHASSSHRLRLEMKGLIRDTAGGLVLTETGKVAAYSTANVEHEKSEEPVRRLDAAGRKRMLDRRIDFS